MSSYYIYGDIEQALGTLKVDSEYEPYSVRPYEKRSYRNFEGTKLAIYTNPMAGYLPLSMIDFKYLKHFPIFELGNRLPNLKVSSVEYALDFFCRNTGRPQNVRNLFLLFRHYLYRRRVNTTNYYTNRENYTYYIGEGKIFKTYERGEDKKQLKGDDGDDDKGWVFKDLDRVRLEYTLKKADVGKYDLKSYVDFLTDCKFSEVMTDLFEFRKFRDHIEELPKKWQEYHLKDGIPNGFQDEYLFQKELGNIKSLKKSTAKSFKFITIQSKIKKLIKSYNKRWKNKTQLILSSK